LWFLSGEIEPSQERRIVGVDNMAMKSVRTVALKPKQNAALERRLENLVQNVSRGIIEDPNLGIGDRSPAMFGRIQAKSEKKKI